VADTTSEPVALAAGVELADERLNGVFEIALAPVLLVAVEPRTAEDTLELAELTKLATPVERLLLEIELALEAGIVVLIGDEPFESIRAFWQFPFPTGGLTKFFR
jgi:hypothetical protein